ncbi:cysteine hydrolase family protein [Actinomadura flavalba]|uniref:cysteine hydrolase family protein n=1 Tax=Actinomadura flavalba TaxID=1120938 RepID=UPI000368A05F|nr:isochorismatase family cysteine hydrolase [Actinomadura flavalba]
METTALLVIDLQNDFCTGPTAAARHPGSLPRIGEVARNTARAVERARADGVEVIFVRFVGDPGYQGPSWRRRDRVLGKRPKCLENTWGAEFCEVIPRPGEAVFTKYACFDAFLDPGLERHLTGAGVERLVLAGLYTDVCVDSTARTAFQKGFHITVLTDCTAALHLDDADVLRFMTAVYGARTTTHDRWSPLAPQEDACSPPASNTASR